MVKPIIYMYRGAGCEKCGGSGYAGRIGIFEVLDVNENISRLIMGHVSDDSEIDKTAREQGMVDHDPGWIP